MTLDTLKPKVTEIVNHPDLTAQLKMQGVCDLLQSNIDYYDWVGFYMAHDTEPTLHLWSQAGEPTDHTVIPFGKGICGQVAVSNKNFVVDDVNAQDNYIACSIHVKSEVVIPLFKDGKNIGQIDIDSNTVNAFSNKDELFLEWINEQIASIL
ncbi:GAF domain-containing protein [Nonlabens ulvanivorans]|uniref:GAF domain-containing protein n=1 Tax=Nonlabens ulvanivorans TaxID=906888 RepID=A0A084JYI4_NONUL|nr:GAF domain-containing protein [Nonlabens ulvanivorans]KEZ94018.1 histidine kinase [Nonlabens ulvanivorans]PRX13004.1 GAF domain-containing protein [Nonlabens ulvanivorans]GAL01027.1 GAF domain-containing proteins [Nonlabens ulvanivorans]